MSDIPVYMVVNLKVTDADEYRKYEKGFFPILKKYGGSFLTFDDSPITLDGLTPREGRMIIFSFPSAEVANAWWADQEYQELSAFRRAGTQMEFLTMVHGLPPRG
ncbi:DUF1330 domain-containing protein [Porticoccaceae bacterium]|nr:DUF1330 domain-containing protein [Porticoccaceae bacterium]MDA8920350.1 DUF1330 domain-containing protein [Porticoccaceae bacterium]MDA8935922.1 DUF1330 domain-containing protein [Porticoccaceae bacterium]MDA9559580.1 DUF1330 domain-containing protein [Porticoccaceae bacterium]MDB2319432.1 DUF1330 domain-containing protein [Porticoccaceae bacterium]